MNSDLKKLYQQTLLKHSKQPLNNSEIPDAARATLRNPLCGDEITVYRKINDDGTSQTNFTAQACTICLASASMMTQHLASLATPEAAAFAKSLVSKFKDKPNRIDLPGDLAALSGVLAFPSRIRCATLPFEGLLAVLESEGTSFTSSSIQEPN
ncbi:iron-sulfur cluster assembly scaffold protein [Pelagicoccus sp. SDUM812002]|uniref:iron-sulfur cluster assembly scaffold protein n=1 Tax=Pelagicoccus sp. SDUM812002 TaxID=3041266 RepID=UPI00280CF65F|nr:iron-sulfur cluster assembly scaffold protein [Pelagicoccus sp. SDUM812002]MDQ8186133.1 iron-sulfur cluster assembly scaffold protein [Pelagicoccus sp. SDUM812002]